MSAHAGTARAQESERGKARGVGLEICSECHQVLDRMVGWLLSHGSHAGSHWAEGAANPEARTHADSLPMRGDMGRGRNLGLSMGELTKGPSHTSSHAADTIAC
jgi:hypothetical protein